MGDGKEGDWECGGCRNRNYAFRSFCNRCKQPRVLVDTKTPTDSKWLPRAGDWICTGCTNNNYASREKCKKCGQPKEVAAMPAVGLPGASFPTHPPYFSRGQGTMDQRMNFGFFGTAALQHTLPFTPNWPLGLGGPDKFRSPASSAWPLPGTQTSGFPYANNTNYPQMVPKGWRNGDWICNCGFHNYSSRTQCKKCNASAPPALGTKRLASEEPTRDWENKRLNAGPVDDFLLANRLQQTYPGMEQLPEPNLRAGFRPPFLLGGSPATPDFQMNKPFSQPAPSQLGKGVKQWREGDWMCSNCNNHNYASRSQCNRCKTEKEEATPSTSQPVSVA
uniref:RanBP2-type domain-containing protein n=2 Tax=Kalanchoe fedtschenkoi TaxID=63787 RepID=A0A7N0UBM3_KALFE